MKRADAEKEEKMPLNLQFFAAADGSDNKANDGGGTTDDGASDDEKKGNGDDADGGADNNTDDDSKGGKKGGKAAATFTQDQVSRMMTREKNQGRNAAYTELGIDPKDSKMVAMVKALIESQKTDEQKENEQKSAQRAELHEAQRKAIVAEAKAEAMTLGVGKQYVDDVVVLALSKMTEDSDLKTIIGEFKTKYPIWFAASDDEKGSGKAGMKGTGSAIKSSEKDKKGGEKGLGARLAAQRKASSGKKSYWGNK